MKLSLSGNASLRNVIRRAHLRMAAVAIALAGALLLIVGVATPAPLPVQQPASGGPFAGLYGRGIAGLR